MATPRKNSNRTITAAVTVLLSVLGLLGVSVTDVEQETLVTAVLGLTTAGGTLFTLVSRKLDELDGKERDRTARERISRLSDR